MDRFFIPEFGYTPDIWVLLASLSFIAVLGLYSWGRRSVPGAKPLAIACLLAFLWMAGVLGQVEADAISAKMAWYKSQFLWQVPGAAATTWFSLEFSGYGRWLTRRNWLLFSIPPLLVVVMIITNDYHHLWWHGFTVEDSVRPIYGVGVGLVVGYGWALVFVNVFVFVRLFFRSHQHRWPVVLIIGGQVACRVLFVMYIVNLDLLTTPYLLILALMIPITMYGIALFGFHIFDPLASARRTAIEQMHEGMVVLDRNRRVLNVNPAAEKILGQSAAHLQGKTWQQILAQLPNGAEQNDPTFHLLAEAEGNVLAEITLRQDADIRTYEVARSPLKDHHETTAGWLLLLHDITSRRRVEAQRLKEQQMLAIIGERERLARELHDNLGQVFAFVNAQGQTARLLLTRGEVGAADAHMARLVEVAGEADSDIRESILNLRTRLVQQGISSTLSKYLETYQQRHGIQIQMNAPLDFADSALDPLVETQLLRIIQEALTNIRKHAHAHSVSIVFTLQNGHALVSLQDDGCGFDPAQASGRSVGRLGLHIMQERAEEVGGSLELHSKPGRGTKVTIKVPLAQTPDSQAAYHENSHAYIAG